MTKIINFQKLKDKVISFSKLEDNYDSYGSIAPNEKIISNSLKFIFDLEKFINKLSFQIVEFNLGLEPLCDSIEFNFLRKNDPIQIIYFVKENNNKEIMWRNKFAKEYLIEEKDNLILFIILEIFLDPEYKFHEKQ